MCINAETTSTNSTDYSCPIKTVNLNYQSDRVHIMPLVINSLRGGHTHTHTDVIDKSNFKTPGTFHSGPVYTCFKNCSKQGDFSFHIR